LIRHEGKSRDGAYRVAVDENLELQLHQHCLGHVACGQINRRHHEKDSNEGAMERPRSLLSPAVGHFHLSL
jgi:hypothetical protein